MLILLSLFALWGAYSTYRAGTAAKYFSELSDVFESARFDVAQEESLERKYRLEPSEKTHQLHREAGADLQRQFARAQQLDYPADRALIAEMQKLHKAYLLAIDRMFAAVDAGNTTLVNEIDGKEVDPRFDIIESRIDAAADAHHVEAIKRLDWLTNVQKSVLFATVLVFAIGMGLIVFFSRVLRGQRRRTELAMKQEATAASRSERRLRALVQNASDVILICSADGIVTYQTPTAETAWGYSADGLIGKSLIETVHLSDQPAVVELLAQLRAAPDNTHGTELRVRDATGAWRDVELIVTNLLNDPDVGGMVATARDIAQRKIFEAQLVQQAFHDPLTQLPNRALFVDRLKQAFVRSARRQGAVGVLYLDIDNFKLINDGLGHPAGDALLAEVAERLKAGIRDAGTVARMGDDEFVILLELTDETQAVLAAERIEQQFVRPFQVDGRDFVVTASIGIAVADAGREQPEMLLRNANIAMYRAKANGRARHVVFEAGMRIDSLTRLSLENDLRYAVERGELLLNYQPIVGLASNEVTGAEALVRWRHPVRGLLGPGEFISLAEESGLIVPIGQWVLEQACRQLVAWRTEIRGQAALNMSVNLSPRQFQQPNLVKQVSRALREAGLAPPWLKLEITEGVIMRDVEATIKTLWQLKELGVRLAVDDFGTGYSSLAYLKRLPLDVLKIDRVFVQGVGQNQEDTAIVRAIISLAKTLNLTVTGEGIETAEQAALLRAWGCDRAQGYFFSRPLDAADFADLLRNGDRLRSPIAAA